MDKLERLDPIPISIATNKVIISDKVFSQLVSKLNEQTDTINALITSNAELIKQVTVLKTQLSETQDTIKKLATAIGNLLGGNEL